MFTIIGSILENFSGIMTSGLTSIIRFILNLLNIETGFLDTAQYTGSVHFFFYDTAKIFLMLATIIFFVSIIRSFFPPEKTRRILGKNAARGIIGHIAAALLGIVTPFCSCSAVPVFIGFIEAGVPLGVTFSFLISSPMVNEVALVLLWGLFGWKIALIYISSGIFIAITAGYIIGRLKLERYVEEYVYRISVGSVQEQSISWGTRIRSSASYTVDLLRKIWIYVVIGIAIGAVMHGWAPEGWLAEYAGRSNPFAVLIAVAIGIPLYSNAAGTIPIVRELMRLGIPVGTSLAFMMSVTALSLPEMIILRKVLKPQLLAVFIGIMAVSISAIGYLFNLILL